MVAILEKLIDLYTRRLLSAQEDHKRAKREITHYQQKLDSAIERRDNVIRSTNEG